ncbi:MAG: DegT/DnrJ/EryC1/StrS family aminotransferase [Gemmatimonadota bacterium]
MRTLPPAYSPLGAADLIGTVVDALSGDTAPRLRDELTARYAADTTVLTSSGTHALQLSFELLAAKLGRSPRIGLPGYSCYDIITAAVAAGAKVRLYDIDPVSLGPVWESLADVMPEVDAVLAGNLFAFPLDWQRLDAMAAEHGVVMIEDAAQGIGAEGPAGPSGRHGAASILSFGRGKGWTGGGGGALLVRGALSELAVDLPLEAGGHGTGVWIKATLAWLLGRPTLFRIPILIPGLGVGETNYKEPSTSRALTRVSAHMVRRTDGASHQVVARRRIVAARWRDALHGLAARSALSWCRPASPAHTSGFLRLPIRTGGVSAEDVVRRGRPWGLARAYPKPLHHLEQASSVLDHPTPLPGAEELAATLVTLPTHHWVRERDMKSVAALF